VVSDYPSRGAERPNVAPNPLVETQRPGFCVRSPWPDEDGKVREMWSSAKGWSTDRTKAAVYEYRYNASSVARISSGQVTTVPRHNGYTVEWTVLEDFADDAVTHDV
jgi:hypothetical protein